MKRFFVDTSYIIALEASDDQNHEIAKDHWRGLKDELGELVTTSYIFDELVTFFSSRGRHNKAVKIGTMLTESPTVRFVQVDESVFGQAWTWMKQMSDKSYSFTDCVSFIVMQREGIQDALTFDSHFSQAGFRVLPEN